MTCIAHLRSIAASMLAAGLVACGAPAQPSTSLATPPPAAAHASVQPPAATLAGRDPSETPVPVAPRAVKLNATSWTIPQPRNQCQAAHRRQRTRRAVANSAEWRADGRLSFTTGYEQKAYTFDPAIGDVVAQP